MEEWLRNIQRIIGEIDLCIKDCNNEEITLKRISDSLGYSEFYVSRRFKEISGMQFRDYLRYRRLAFALKDVRDTDKSLLDIALDYGFSSHEAFTRAFKEAYGITPSEYRQKPVPVVMRTNSFAPSANAYHATISSRETSSRRNYCSECNVQKLSRRNDG